MGQIRVGNLLVYENIPGLSSGKLSAICPSANGYLWIGTENGLVRFDGYRYERITTREYSLADQSITDIVQDSNNHIWVATAAKGVIRYGLANGDYRSYSTLGKQGNGKQAVNKMLMLQNGELWLATGGTGLAKYISAIDSFQFFNPVKETWFSEANHIIDMVQDKKQPHLIWLISRSQLFCFDTKRKLFNEISTGNYLLTELQCIEYDDEGLWLGTIAQGMYYYSIANRTCSQIPFKVQGAEVNRIHQLDVFKNSDTSILWACADFGLLSYHKKTRQCSFIGPAFREDNTQKNSYSFLRINYYKSTGLLVSMEGAYLQIHPAYMRLNKVLTPVKFPLQKHIKATAVIEDRQTNQYLVAAEGELAAAYLDRSLQNIQPVFLPQQSNATAMKDAVSDKQAVSWLLGNDGLLYNVSGNQLLQYTQKNWKGKAQFIETDADDDVWMITDTMLYRWNMLTDKVPAASIGLPAGSIIKEMKADRFGFLWMATNNGLCKISKKENSLTVVKIPGNPDVTSVAVNSSGKIWILDKNSKIGFYNVTTGSYRELVKSTGYPDAAIHQLALAADSLLLATTTAGLFIYNTNTGNWKHYNKLDGLYQNNLANGMIALPGGTVFINNYYNFHAFGLDELQIPAQQMQVTINNFIVNGKEQPVFRQNNGEYRFQLSYNQNNIRIDFAAMHWLYPMRTVYQYRINRNDNNDEDWQSTMIPLLQLAPLQPGTYNIQLRAIGADGAASEITNMELVIQAPFWKTTWFLLLCVTAAIAVCVLLFRLRINQLRKTTEMRNSISRNLHDDIGSTLTSISILSTVSQAAIDNNPDKAKEMMEQIASQSKTIQQNMSDIVWAIKTENDKVENLISRMREYIGQTLEPKQVNTVFETDEEVLHLSLPMQHRKELLLIFKEAVHNILKHAGANTVIIRFDKTPNQLQLIIADNGSWKVKQTSSGTGTSSIKQRAESLGGKATIEGSSTGTIVTVVIALP